jgi:3D (Asp-Asp-Asp) domain-containing protein
VRALRERRYAPGTIVAASLAAALALSGAGGAGASPRTAALTRQQATLGSRAHAALMSLYSLDSRLLQARAALADLRTQISAVRAKDVRVAQDLGIARRAWTDSVEALGTQLRAMYEGANDQDALAVLFGASSIDDAVARLDAMRWSARLNRQTIEQTRAAQEALARLRTQLAARLGELRGLEADVAATATSLASARDRRVAYLRALSRQRALNGREIARLRTAAHQITQRSQVIAAQQKTAPVFAPVVSPSPAGRTLTVTSTGYSLAGHTATGMPVGWGIVAVDPSIIPLGTKLTIPGYGQGVAADTGGAVQGATIDLWFPTPAQALTWGRRTVTVTLH